MIIVNIIQAYVSFNNTITITTLKYKLPTLNHILYFDVIIKLVITFILCYSSLVRMYDNKYLFIKKMII